MFKGGDPTVPANYRPITLTSVVGKVLERLVKEQMEAFLCRCNRWCSQQHGFTRNRSCVTNLLLAREHWCESVDLSQRLDVVFIDFSKAFDRVPHRRLLVKLEGLGIREPLLGWIKAFITDRSNRVEVNGALSSTVVAASSLPQGFVLGPFLLQ